LYVLPVAQPLSAGARASRSAGPSASADGRLRLLAAAEQLMAARGLEVPNRVIVAAAGQHNQSAITYHFRSRAGLIDAIREQHETPIAQHSRYLISRLPGPEDRTTRQLVEAHIQPLTTEMLRCSPSRWARFSEMLLLDQPLRFTREGGRPMPARPDEPARAVLSELLELMVRHLTHLPELEAADRVSLTIRFLISSLARWEHDSQAGIDDVAQLAPFTLFLTDLAVAMLDAPSSVPPHIDGQLR
jgi:TetR/AcrR family transcriptional regulator, regulator of cefoperazone and chloramphenicol sensitivity